MSISVVKYITATHWAVMYLAAITAAPGRSGSKSMTDMTAIVTDEAKHYVALRDGY